MQYGDHGPNKFSATANGMLFYGSKFNAPAYTLMQRDRLDAPEPYSMFWYDPSVSGAFWTNLALDHYFDDGHDQWASMRTSWTDNTGLYLAIKAGNHTGHQAHGDLDAGDFVLDAMGDRWAGELGSGQYLSDGYFSNEFQTSQRWLYYRKRTEGQNCVVVGNANQNVNALPVIKYDSTKETQPGGTTVYTVPDSSTAYFTADLTATYDGTYVPLLFTISTAVANPSWVVQLVSPGDSTDQWTETSSFTRRHYCHHHLAMAHAHQCHRRSLWNIRHTHHAVLWQQNDRHHPQPPFWGRIHHRQSRSQL